MINMKKVVFSEKAPAAIGPYSQAIKTEKTIYVSGQLPIDPATGKFVEGGVAEQTHQSLKNVKAILNEAGYDFCDVVKTTVFLSDIADFAAMNEVYKQYYQSECPARSAFAVKSLPMGALVEIETIASK